MQSGEQKLLYPDSMSNQHQISTETNSVVLRTSADDTQIWHEGGYFSTKNHSRGTNFSLVILQLLVTAMFFYGNQKSQGRMMNQLHQCFYFYMRDRQHVKKGSFQTYKVLCFHLQVWLFTSYECPLIYLLKTYEYGSGADRGPSKYDVRFLGRQVGKFIKVVHY